MREHRSEEVHESRQSLWLLTAAPSCWAAHFLACYVTASIWCAKLAGHAGALGGARTMFGALTALALVVISMVGWHGYRRHTFGGTGGTHEFDTPEDRHRFLGFATVLLAGLSAAATLFTAMAVFYFEDCRS